MKMTGGTRAVLALAVIASLFLAACGSTSDDNLNDPDMFGDAEDDGLDTGTYGNNDAATDTTSAYGDTATGDTRSEARGTTSSQYTGSEGTGGTTGTTGMETDTRSNARGEVTADTFGQGDSNIYEDGDGMTTSGVTTSTTRSNARASDVDATVDTYVTSELNLGDEWMLVRTMTLDTEPEETTIYVYAKTDDTTSNARMTTTTMSTNVNTYAGMYADDDVESDDSSVDTRSNAREVDDGSGTTSIILVDSETRSSYRGATVSTVDDDAALLYVIVRGGAVVGAVTADDMTDVRTVATSTRFNARATVDDDEDDDNVNTGSAPWNTMIGSNDDDDDNGLFDTRSNARGSDDDEDDVEDTGSAGSPWNDLH